MAGLGSTDRALRPACRLAVAVALEGERADPPMPAPPALRPVLGFSRLSAASYAVIRRVIDEDGTFRARVAEQAEESAVGRAGWLWLHRPVDWADDPVFAGDEPAPVGETSASAAGAPSRAAKGDDPHRERTAKLRRQLADAEVERKRLAGVVAEQRRSLEEADADRADLDARLTALREERNAAVRASKAVEAELATARRDLKAARAAARQAEQELAEERSARARPHQPAAPGPSGSAASDAPVPPAVVTPPATPVALPVEAVASSVSAAAVAAAELARALGEVAELVAGDGAPPVGAGATPAPDDGHAAPAAPSAGRRGDRTGPRSRAARRPPQLPPGVFDGTDEAVRHLVSDPENLLVVDGYNLARAAWTGLAPEEERRRTVALLEEVQARSGGSVVAVFDGDGSVVAPLASRHVRVRFSARGQTADELIAELVATVPLERPVVVVSADRAVADDARRQGAVAVGSRDLLRATGR